MKRARPGAVIAIDHGTRRTGFAVADALRIASEPLETFRGAGDSPQLLAHVAVLLEQRDVDIFVVGMPFNMDGTLGPRGEDVKRFISLLSARFPHVRVVAHDERLTTKAAEELGRDLGFHGAELRARRDSLSALVLLRDWLSAHGTPSDG